MASVENYRPVKYPAPQRIKIAKMILDDKTYDEIAEKIGTSTATVSKIGQVIKYGKGSFQKEFGGEKHGS